MPRRRGLRPRLLAAMVRSKATLAFAAERQVVGQSERRMGRELQFSFDGAPVGYFEEPSYPREAGEYRYMPFRGIGHYNLGRALAEGACSLPSSSTWTSVYEVFGEFQGPDMAFWRSRRSCFGPLCLDSAVRPAIAADERLRRSPVGDLVPRRRGLAPAAPRGRGTIAGPYGVYR